MDLVGAWLRQLLKAGTAAAIVPAAMVAALAVVIIGAGGFGGLGSLSQLVAGPQILPIEVAAARNKPDIAPLPPAAKAPPARTRKIVAAPPPPPPPPVVVAPPPILPPPPPPPPARQPPPPPPPPPPAEPAPEVTPSPTRAPKPVLPPALDETAQQLTEGLKQTVGDVGTVVGQIIDGVRQALVQILGPRPPASR